MKETFKKAKVIKTIYNNLGGRLKNSMTIKKNTLKRESFDELEDSAEKEYESISHGEDTEKCLKLPGSLLKI